VKSFFFLYLIILSLFSSACDEKVDEPGLQTADSGSDDDDDAELPTVTSDQENEMCDDLGGSTGKFVMAGSELGQGQVISPGPGSFLVELVDQGDGFGGFVEISSVDETPLFMLVKETVPTVVAESDGSELAGVDTNAGSGTCSAAAGAYLWIVENGPNHLKFGPTSTDVFHIALERVD
jgi:hypothetical protein